MSGCLERGDVLVALVETNIGDEFDPDRHEAISQIPAEKKENKGKIIDVIEGGYSLGDQIIKFPKVVVAQ